MILFMVQNLAILAIFQRRNLIKMILKALIWKFEAEAGENVRNFYMCGRPETNSNQWMPASATTNAMDFDAEEFQLAAVHGFVVVALPNNKTPMLKMVGC